MEPDASRLRELFRRNFRADPAATYPEWFRLQERLREEGRAALALALADDLWGMLGEIEFPGPGARARFLHDAGVMFGCRGPAGDLARARACFELALGVWREEAEPAARSRALHNLGNALANLGRSAGELREALSCYDQALRWRSAEREIARGVTRHSMGLAWRRLAELSAEDSAAALERSAEALREALEIRERHGLAEGMAGSRFQLGLTLRKLSRLAEARGLFLRAAEEFDRLGLRDQASLAREVAAGAPDQEAPEEGAPPNS